MNQAIRWLLVLAGSFLLSSCFEIREEVTINSDESGNYKLLLDFSQNRQMLKLITDMAENEETNPFGSEGNPFYQVDSLFSSGSSQLNAISGIRNSLSIKDDINFVYGLSFDFQSIRALNTAIAEMQSAGQGGDSYKEYYRFDKKTLIKTSVFNLTKLTQGIKPDANAEERGEDINRQLQEMYESITYKHVVRSEKIKNYSNELAQINGDKNMLILTRSLRDIQRGDARISNEIKIK
jgi:hypothetical protein